jgi:hypothetical protein
MTKTVAEAYRLARAAYQRRRVGASAHVGATEKFITAGEQYIAALLTDSDARPATITRIRGRLRLARAYLACLKGYRCPLCAALKAEPGPCEPDCDGPKVAIGRRHAVS